MISNKYIGSYYNNIIDLLNIIYYVVIFYIKIVNHLVLLSFHLKLVMIFLFPSISIGFINIKIRS